MRGPPTLGDLMYFVFRSNANIGAWKFCDMQFRIANLVGARADARMRFSFPDLPYALPAMPVGTSEVHPLKAKKTRMNAGLRDEVFANRFLKRGSGLMTTHTTEDFVDGKWLGSNRFGSRSAAAFAGRYLLSLEKTLRSELSRQRFKSITFASDASTKAKLDVEYYIVCVNRFWGVGPLQNLSNLKKTIDDTPTQRLGILRQLSKSYEESSLQKRRRLADNDEEEHHAKRRKAEADERSASQIQIQDVEAEATDAAQRSRVAEAQVSTDEAQHTDEVVVKAIVLQACVLQVVLA